MFCTESRRRGLPPPLPKRSRKLVIISRCTITRDALTVQISDAVAVAVFERSHVYLIDNAGLPPIGFERVAQALVHVIGRHECAGGDQPQERHRCEHSACVCVWRTCELNGTLRVIVNVMLDGRTPGVDRRDNGDPAVFRRLFISSGTRTASVYDSRTISTTWYWIWYGTVPASEWFAPGISLAWRASQVLFSDRSRPGTR